MARVLVTVLVLALVAAAAQAGEKQHIAGALKLAGNLAAHGHPGAALKVVVNAGKEEAHKVADAVHHKVAAVKAVVHHEKQHVAGALHAAAALAKHGHAGAAGKVLAHVGKEELHKVSAALHSHSKRSVVEKIVAAKKVEAIVNSLPPKKPTLADKVKNFKKQHQKKATHGEKVRHVLAAKKVANALINAHSIGKRHVVPQVGEKHHIAGALKLAGNLAAHGHPGAALKVVVNAGKEEAHKVADAVHHKVAAVKAVVHHEKQHVAGALHAAAALAKHGHAGAAGKVLAHVGKDELHKVSAALHSHSKRSVVEKIVAAKKVEAIVNSLPPKKPTLADKVKNFKKQHQKKATLGQKVGKVLAVKQELHKRHQKKATLGEKVGHVLAAKKVANALSNAHSIGKRHVVPQVGEKHHIAGALKLAGNLAAHGHPGAALKVVVNAGKEEAHKVADAVRHKVAAVKAVVHHEKQHVAGALHAAAALAKHGHAGAAGKVLAHVGKEELHKVSAALHSHSKRNVVEKIHNVVEATHGHQPAHQPQQRHKILNTVHTVVEARNIISHLPRH